MAFTKFGLFALFAFGSAHASHKPAKQPPVANASALPAKAHLAEQGAFAASGHCWNQCKEETKLVAILHGSKCYCSNNYPARSLLVDDSQCNYPCAGYAFEACGGIDTPAYSVYNTGLELLPESDGGDDGFEDDDSTSAAVSSTTTHDVKATSHTTSATETEESTTTATIGAEETSQVPPVVNEQPAASTPSASASAVPENASPRLSNPIGNIVRMMVQLL
ncbi:hypothetical protein ACLX1H_000771 [Fusarium chlamydosporum]